LIQRGAAGGEWFHYSVTLMAIATASDARITWLLDNRADGGLPDSGRFWLSGASLLHVVPENPDIVSFTSDVQLFFGGDSSVEPQAGWKVWRIEDVRKPGDFHVDRFTKLVTTFCASGMWLKLNVEFGQEIVEIAPGFLQCHSYQI
jgi:hypothetical protein